MNHYARAKYRELVSDANATERDITRLEIELDGVWDDYDEDCDDDWGYYHRESELRQGIRELESELDDLREKIAAYENGEYDEYHQELARLKWYGGGTLPQSLKDCEWWTIPLYP